MPDYLPTPQGRAESNRRRAQHILANADRLPNGLGAEVAQLAEEILRGMSATTASRALRRLERICRLSMPAVPTPAEEVRDGAR